MKFISLDVKVLVATASAHRYKAVGTQASQRDVPSWAGGAGCSTLDLPGAQLVPEYTDNLFRLAFAEQTMVHVNAYQLVTDGLDQQSGYNR